MRFQSILIIVMLLTVTFSTAAFSAKVEEGVDYMGWKCVRLSNQNTQVYLAPELGGRIIQYVVDGHSFLWVNESLAGQVVPLEKNLNMETWTNYGGDKIWPAPQGWYDKQHWPGPGDEVIDAAFSYEVLKGKGSTVKVRMTGSEAGGYTGVQFVREFELRDDSTRLDLTTTMNNVSKREVSWGIWSVTQMDWSDKDSPKKYNEQAKLVIPMNPDSIWPERYKVMFGLASSFNWQPDYETGLLTVTFENLVGKLGMDNNAGWLAMVDEKSGYTYVQRFPYFPGETYPDKSSVEVWVAGAGQFIHDKKLRIAADDPKGRLIEMEILGPQKTLAPGESTSISTSWEAHKGGLSSVPDLDKGYVAR